MEPTTVEAVKSAYELNAYSLALGQALITAVVTIVLAWFKSSTDQKLAKIYKIARDTHTLANSGHRAALLINARGERRWATEYPEEQNQLAAIAAEKLLADHDDAQKSVNIRNEALSDDNPVKDVYDKQIKL